MTRTRVFGIAAVLLALAAWAGSAVVAFSAFQSRAQWQAPGSQSMQLTAGKWTVVQKLPADSTAITPSDIESARTVNADQVTIVDSTGANVPVTCVYCAGKSQSALPIDLQLANEIVDFTVTTPGTYTVTVKAMGQMAVANPVAKLEEVMPWVTILGSLGGILLALGVTLIIRGKGPTVSGSQTGPPQANVGPAPPGWYQNPYLPDTDSQMWWDGSKWTSNWR